mgnify:FL=1
MNKVKVKCGAKQLYTDILEDENGKYIKYPLSGKLSNNSFTLVDLEDHSDLPFCSITLTEEGYARFKNNGKQTRLQRYIMRNHAIDGKEIDNIDGDRLNNRKINLRCVTTQQNQMNKSKMKDASNKYKGVYYVDSKYRAVLVSKGKKYSIGYYKTEESAARAYNEKCLEICGEYGRLNIIEEK